MEVCNYLNIHTALEGGLRQYTPEIKKKNYHKNIIRESNYHIYKLINVLNNLIGK